LQSYTYIFLRNGLHPWFFIANKKTLEPRLWDNIETLLKRNMGKPLLWESHGEMVLGEYGKGVVSL